ncbi:ParM/StbA family protein [Clostridium sp.]|uniref:ParM/StbA family protein n=1 Tax=Clostridium sp. TaxID=1506 RepID=UPI003F3FDEA1
MAMNLIVGNDNGNSEHDIIINGEIIKQPNVHAKVRRLANLEELNPEYIAKNIHDNLIVSIESQQLNSGTPTTYYIGTYATKTGQLLKNIEVGADNSKIESDIPLVNTLGQIAGYAVKKAYEEDQEVASIDVKVDMTTALPVTQYSKQNAQTFTNRFIGNHLVTVYLGTKQVKVNLNMEYVKVLPEGVPTIFYLQSNKDQEIVLKEFSKDYGINMEDVDFKNKRILHVAIGEGTTEYPLTEDIGFNPHFIRGTNNGVGHAINSILQEFIQEKNLGKFSRQDFSTALRNTNHKYHVDAVEFIQDPLEEQATVILDCAKQEITKANNEVDYICVYGGGSILMKPYLKDKVRQFADKTDIKVLYISDPHSVEVEARGMYEFANSPIFKQLKKGYIQNKKK